LSQVLTSLCCT